MSEEVWGWSHYFSELARFFQSIENNFGSANRQYTEYCISRLALCYRNVDAVKESVQTHNNDAESNGDLQTIEQDLTELLECISQMFSQWQQYLHTIDEEDDSIRYRAPIQAPSGSRGTHHSLLPKNNWYICVVFFLVRNLQAVGSIKDDNISTTSRVQLD